VLGTAIDLITVIILVEFFFLHPILAAFFGFVLAVTNNFFLNKIWTFQNKSTNYRKLWIKFFLVSTMGLGITLLLMFVFYQQMGIDYRIAKLMTSAIVLVWNFLANKFWTFRAKEHFPHLPESYDFELSIVIPAYNEENRIKNTLVIINDYLRNTHIKAEILVVSDGSNDRTNQIVRNCAKKIPNITLISHRKNKGKGYSVKCGVEKSKGKYILMADADNSTPIEEYTSLKKQMNKNDIAIGSRYIKAGMVKRKQSPFRIFIGRSGNALIRLFLIDNIADSQCGFKLFHHHAAKEIFFRQKVHRFGFDVEVIVIAMSLGYNIAEVPVSWFNSVESRFRPIRDAVRTFFDLIYIKLNLWSGRYR
jgi:dolichyl-phosphate beta-glucosyltransferase